MRCRLRNQATEIKTVALGSILTALWALEYVPSTWFLELSLQFKSAMLPGSADCTPRKFTAQPKACTSLGKQIESKNLRHPGPHRLDSFSQIYQLGQAFLPWGGWREGGRQKDRNITPLFCPVKSTMESSPPPGGEMRSEKSVFLSSRRQHALRFKEERV